MSSDYDVLLNALRELAIIRAVMLSLRSMRGADVAASGGSEWVDHWHGQTQGAPEQIERTIHEAIATHRKKSDAVGATSLFLAWSRKEIHALEDLACALIVYPHGPAEDLTRILDELAAALLVGGSLLVVVQGDGRWSRVFKPAAP